jgi:hypothetical protein
MFPCVFTSFCKGEECEHNYTCLGGACYPVTLPVRKALEDLRGKGELLGKEKKLLLKKLRKIEKAIVETAGQFIYYITYIKETNELTYVKRVKGEDAFKWTVLLPPC